jgi:hypothetical protein
MRSTIRWYAGWGFGTGMWTIQVSDDNAPAELGQVASRVIGKRVLSKGADNSELAEFGQGPTTVSGPPPRPPQFLHTIADHRLYAAYHLIALHGLRRGQAAGLRW